MDKNKKKKIENMVNDMSREDLEVANLFKNMFLKAMAEVDPVSNMLKAHSDLGDILNRGIIEKIFDIEDDKERDEKSTKLANVLYQFCEVLKDFQKENM